MKTRRSRGSTEGEPCIENEEPGQNIKNILFGGASSGVVIPESPAVSPDRMKSVRLSMYPDTLTSVVETPEDMLPANHIVIKENFKVGQSFSKDRGKAKSLIPVLQYSSTEDDDDFMIIDVRPRSATKTKGKSKNDKKSSEPTEKVYTFKTPEKDNPGFGSSDEDLNDSTFVNVTPDVISRKKNLMGILESEHSFTKTIKSQKFKNSTANVRPRSTSKTKEKSKNAKNSIEPTEKVYTFKTPEKKNRGVGSSDEDMNDSTFVDVTPDVISRKKNLMGILESERSFTKTIKSRRFKNSTAINNLLEDTLDDESYKSKDLGTVFEGSYCDKKEEYFPRPVTSPFKKNRRKSLKLEQVIMPFDDTMTVNAKQNLARSGHPNRRKSVCATPTSEGKKSSSKSTPKNNVFVTPRSTAMALARANRRSLNQTPVTPQNNDSSDDEIEFKGFKGAKNSVKKKIRQEDIGATVLFDSQDLSLTPIRSNSQIDLHSSVSKIINSLENSKDISDPKLSFQNFSTRSSKNLQNTAAKGKTKLVFHEYDDDDDIIVATQPSCMLVLQDVVSYVEVRVGCDNRSAVVIEKLKSLGADVRDKFTSDVTHVIFKDGSKATFNKAKKKRLHIVSSLWVEECREKMIRVPEVKFPSCSLEQYSSPLFSSRVRKLKSMQPKEFSEDESAATNKVKRRIKKLQSTETPTEDFPESPARNIYQEDVDVNSPLFGIGHLLTPKRKRLSTTPNSQASTSSLDDTLKSPSRMPLAKRLYDKFTTPKTSEEITPEKCLPLRTDSCSNKKQVNTSDNEIDDCESTSPIINKKNGKLDTKDSIVRVLSLNSTGGDNDPSESYDLLLSDSSSERIDTNILVNPKNVKNRKFIEKDKKEQKHNDIPLKSEKLEIINSFRKVNKQPDFTHGRRRSILKSTEYNNDEPSPAKTRRKSVRYSLPPKSVSPERSKENIPVAPNTPHSKVKQTKIKKSLNLKNKSNMVLVQEESILSSQIISSQIISSQLSSQSTSSQITLSQSRRRKLLSQDFIPSQDLIIPSTPEHPAKYREDPYSQLEIQGSKTQRQAIKLTKSEGKSVPLPRNLSSQESSSSHNTEDVRLTEATTMSLPSTSSGQTVRSRPVRKTRSCQPQSTPDDVFNSSDDENYLKNSRFELLPRERRSTEEFKISNGKFKSKNSRNLRKGARPRLCLTSVHTNEVDGLIQIVKKLGRYNIVDDVDIYTTHIVCGQQRRTLNMLYGISRGAWILDVTWLFESLEMGFWAPEEPFEIFLFCPGAKVCREQRFLKGTSYQQTLFSGVGSICVLEGCTPPPHNIKELLELCGATLVSDKRDANIAVGKPIVGSNTRCQVNAVTHVSEKWVMDSIQHHIVKSTQEYAINQSRSETRSSIESNGSL